MSDITTNMDIAQVLYNKEIARTLNINETIARGNSSIQQFYSGAVVLVTGGSGFLGKQLIEKLFRSCQIKKIYVLLRQNKDKILQQRVENIIRDELFEYLRENQPDFVNKLIPIAGDITENRLGLSEDNWKTLIKEVNIIFHVAATINFLEPLRVATLTNVRGTREMLTLAKSCKQLQSFVHISTAYSHATPERVKQPVLEKFYDSPVSPEFLIQLAEDLDEKKMDEVTAQLLRSWPNTYAFTKAVAEEMVRTTAGDLPICIVRPAIVMQGYREPPGWADKSTMNNSAIGFIVGICVGGLHVFLAKPKTNLDIVPVDIVNNAAIAAAHETVVLRAQGQTDVKIYTVSRYRSPVTIGALVGTLKSKEIAALVTPKIIWYPFCLTSGSWTIFFLISWLLHFLPGYLADGVLAVSGRKRKVIKLFDKAYRQNKIYAFYTFNDWQFDDSNLVHMMNKFSPADEIIYDCNAAGIELRKYITCGALGARKYIFRDGLKDTEYARKRLFWFGILNAIYLMVYAFIVWKIVNLMYGVLSSVFNF